MSAGLGLVVFLILLTLLFTYPRGVKGGMAGALGRSIAQAANTVAPA